MKTVYVLATQPDLLQALRAVLGPESHRLVPQTEWTEDLARMSESVVDAVVIDVDHCQAQPLRIVERIRRRLPECPVILFARERSREWEEDAYLVGVTHVFSKPVRGKLLLEILGRIWKKPAGHGSNLAIERAALPALQGTDTAFLRPAVGPASPPRALEVLRDYSEVLSHSLCAEALLKQFILFIRNIMGVNRAAIFLRTRPSALAQTSGPDQSHRLRSACAIGLAPGMLEHFELSLETGIGRHLLRSGRILRYVSDDAIRDPGLRKEFELLGAQVAIPILDRESLVGVATFDNRITGEAFTSEELTLTFHLLEQLGMAIRNTWLHEELAVNHDLMADTLGHLSSGCVVVNSNSELLHINDAAREVLLPDKPAGLTPEFGDIPQIIGSRVFEVLKSGSSIAPFKYRPPNRKDRVYQISVAPFQRPNTRAPMAALLLIEDFTQVERLQKLDIEAANLRLIRLMSERLAHEIGNAIVPLSTHQQLFNEKFRDQEFRTSLEEALSSGVKRVSRLVKQMLFLARDTAGLEDELAVSKLIEDAFKEAQGQHSEASALLHYENSDTTVITGCDKAGLKHALVEIMLNALQSNPASPQVRVSTRSDRDAEGLHWIHIEIQDGGPGFTSESSLRGHEPFFTTRNVGVGLGLTVSRKLIELHRGRLDVRPSVAGRPGAVIMSLPLGKAGAPAAQVPERDKLLKSIRKRSTP